VPCNRHACIFCPETFLNLEGLMDHLFVSHRDVEIPIGDQLATFRIYYHTGYHRVLCFCGERGFTCNSASLRVAPAINKNWILPHGLEINSYEAHLRCVDGLAAHLQDLRDQAALDKIGGPAPDYNPVLRPGSSLSRFLGESLADLQVDKIEPPEVE
jgi:hypothetical protein